MFYAKLKDLRKLRGFTLRELAERSGVSHTYISQLENGRRGTPSPEMLMKLSEGLNVPYGELMALAGYLEDAPDVPRTHAAQVNLRRFLRDNALIFDGIVLTDTDKEWVERMLTALFWKERRRQKRLPAADAETQ